MISRKLLTMTIAFGIAALVSTNVSAAAQTKRLWGNDRYKTCSAIVEQGWQSSSYDAVIVNGENFPDALSAAPLAQKYNAPILLTGDSTLDTNTVAQLKRLNVKNVFIVGGEGVVRPSVEKEIKKLGIQTTRYKGEDRDKTALKVASQIGTKNGIIVTTNSDYVDALSAAPIAASLQMPIILVSKDSYTSGLDNFILMNHIPKTYVLGDTDIITDRIASIFPNVQRITGKDKYERNINIIKTFEDKVNFNNICVAYSEKFADALSGSVFAATNGNPIILVGDEPTGCTNNFIKDKLNSISSVTILGGTAGIKDSSASKLMGEGSGNPDNNGPVLNENEGNTSGNLRNGGFVIEKDNWIYYIKNGSKIYRIKTDGTEETRVADVKNAKSINIVNNNIYYVGASNTSSKVNSRSESISIYKGSASGGFRDTLISDNEDDFGKGYPYMKVVGNWVYYSPTLKFISKENSYFYESIYKMDVDTRESKLSSGEYFKCIEVEGGYIYFTTRGDDRIRKMPTNGNKKNDGTTDNKEVYLGINGTLLDVVNGYIYYNDIDGDTYKIKEDGTSKTKIASIPDKHIIHGNVVYYVVQGKDNLYQLRKMNIDGTGDTGLNAYKVDSFSITGDWVYYRKSGNGNIYRIKLDGTSREQFPDKIDIKRVDDINVKVKKGESYELPIAVSARMQDDSNEHISIKWDKTTIDTSVPGIYKFLGTIDGYNTKVNLSVEVY